MLNSAGLDLVGASDSDATAGREKVRRWQIPFSEDPDEMTHECQPDFLFVLPRHDRAPREIARVAASGLPFLVEKPLGLDAAGASLAAEAVARAGVYADVCLPLRHTGIWAAFDEIHRPWSLEDLAYAHFRTINGPPERYSTYGVPWMLDRRLSGGGTLRNLGFHGVDAALALAGGVGRITVESAALIRRPGDGVERFATATLRTAEDALITLEAGYAIAAHTGTDQEWRISTGRALLCQRDGISRSIPATAMRRTSIRPAGSRPMRR